MGFTELEPPGPVHRSCFKEEGLPFFKVSRAGLFLIIILLLPAYMFGQRKSDIGLSGGTGYYMGDLNFTRHFYMPSAAGGALIRYNLNPRNSFRISGIYTNLRANDPKLTDDYHSLSSFNTSILDLAFTTEFNFRTYKTTKIRKERQTPYVTGGFTYSIVLGGDVPQAESTPGLAFGAGYKYNLTVRLGTGIEWAFRKTFNDNLDGVSNPGPENNVFFHNKDWYSLVQVFITYKIFDWREDCPAYDF
jgi:hypothetical protein